MAGDYSSSSSRIGGATDADAKRSSRLTGATLFSLPVHCLTDADLRLEGSRGVYEHFHAPTNSHSRSAAMTSAIDRAILRDVQRPPQFRASSGSALRSGRPATAPEGSRGRNGGGGGGGGGHGAWPPPAHAAAAAAAAQALDTLATGRGVPCLTVPAVFAADVLDGRPASAALCAEQPWRVARVVSHAVPPSAYGYGDGGRRPFHQSYAFYKHFGFAGQGAKTSWASSASKQPPPVSLAAAAARRDSGRREMAGSSS